MSTGMLGWIGIAKQNSFGTASSSYYYLDFLSESLAPDIETIRLEGIRQRFAEGPSLEGYEEIVGDVAMELSPLMAGHFLRAVTNNSTVTAVDSSFSHKFLPAQSDWTADCTLPPYTIQVNKDTTESFEFTDSIVNKVEFTLEPNDVLKMTAGIIARTTSLMTAAGPSYVAATPWAWHVMSATMVGSAFGDFEALTISLENPAEGRKLMNATKRVAKLKRTGFQEVRISGTMDFETNSQWEVFKAQTERAFVGYFGLMTSSGPTLKIDIPNLRYTALNPNVDGPGPISVDFDADGKYDVTSNYAIEFTLVNTFADYDY